jgi:hypothetical protein
LASTRRGIADVTHRCVARKSLEDVSIEHFRNQSQSLVKLPLALMDCADAGGFLPSVLEGIKGQENLLGGLLHSRDADDAALVLGRFFEKMSR